MRSQRRTTNLLLNHCGFAAVKSSKSCRRDTSTRRLANTVGRRTATGGGYRLMIRYSEAYCRRPAYLAAAGSSTQSNISKGARWVVRRPAAFAAGRSPVLVSSPPRPVYWYYRYLFQHYFIRFRQNNTLTLIPLPSSEEAIWGWYWFLKLQYNILPNAIL